MIGGVGHDRHFVEIWLPLLEWGQAVVRMPPVAPPVLFLDSVAEAARFATPPAADGLGVIVLLAVGHCAVTTLIY